LTRSIVYKADFKTATDDVARFEAEHSALGDIEHLNERKQKLQETMKTNKSKLSELAVRSDNNMSVQSLIPLSERMNGNK
jgi:hypothetical protein